MKARFNYFFFVIAVVIPLVVAPLGIILLWPLVFNPYQILGVYGSIIVAYLWMFIFTWGIAAYIALPWLAVIREDKITFHRLFRRRLVVNYGDIERVEFLCNHMPIENYRYGLGHLLIYKKDKDRIFVGGVPHSIVIELRRKLKKLGIDVDISTRNLTKEEIKDMEEGKIKK